MPDEPTLPGIAGEIEALIGLELTRRLLRRRGGCQMVVPVRAHGSLMAEIIGEEATAEMIRGLGPGRITLPCADQRGPRARRAEAKALLRAGSSIQQVALACDLHTHTVSKYRAEIVAEAGDPQLRFSF